MNFIEPALNQLAGIIKDGYLRSETAMPDGFMQRLDARVKLMFMAFFLLIIGIKGGIPSQALIFVFTISLAVATGLSPAGFLKRTLPLAVFFGLLPALPAILNVITPGDVLFAVIKTASSRQFGPYRVPAEIGPTIQGVEVASRLTLRVLNSISVTFLVMSTTRFHELIRALKMLRVPDTFLLIVILAHKYIFIFAKVLSDIYLAKKSRLIGGADGKDARGWITSRMAFIFRKSRHRYEEIFGAMMSRGFADGIRLPSLKTPEGRDWMAGVLFFTAGCIIVWL
ncbi:MAG: energy-coupling factor transporter transmembrane component T [Desulfobacteraceae bacterium]|nr:energy-coupling factor transporter transmembrane component T [Desulfobacteraceae bacterium]